ncbi:MAG: hypothetical protein E7477_01575 [Ruminococcaceae bacterium]|nr:hypothetical protein [Oscillospiraceae bacterium]
MKKFKSVYISILAFLLLLSACNSNIQEDINTPDIPEISVEEQGTQVTDQEGTTDTQQPENEVESEEQNPPKEKLPVRTHHYLDSRYSVQDGKVISLKDWTDKKYSDIKNATYVSHNRYIFCDDGSIVDLYYNNSSGSISEALFEINKTDPIIRIEREKALFNDWNQIDVLYAKDGTVYYPLIELKSDYTYEYNYIKTEAKDIALFDLNGTSIITAVDQNGTLSFHDSTDFSKIEIDCPELEAWTDITEIVACKDMIIGLKSDGTVVSYGTEFTAENVAMIDIADDGSADLHIPVALTNDGRLIFGEDPYESDHIIYPYQRTIRQAECFTDVIDFAFYDGLDAILVQKSDGSLWSTYNNHIIYLTPFVTTLKKDDFIEEVHQPSFPEEGLQIGKQSYLDSENIVINGKVINIGAYESGKIVPEIDNALYVSCRRFVFCDDGKVIDLFDDEMTFIINKISKSYKITKIEHAYAGEYIVHTEKGPIYMLYGACIPIDAKEVLRISKNLGNGQYDSKIIILNHDGTITFCDNILSDGSFEKVEGVYPEIEAWTDIIDIAVNGEMVIGLKSDGTVVSYGTDFSLENVAMIDIFHEFDIPVALTTDGKLIFGEDPLGEDLIRYTHQRSIKQAESFTDVVDFRLTYYGGEGILVQKADGSLWATYYGARNHSEYVNILTARDVW